MVNVLKTHQDLVDLLDVNKKLVSAFEDVCQNYAKLSPYEIDQVFREKCRVYQIHPSSVNYHGFPGSLCVSINDCIAHGVPKSRKKLSPGDIVTLDATGYNGRFHSDLAHTFIVNGENHPNLRHLSKVTKEALDNAVKICKPGTAYCDLSQVIFKTASDGGIHVIERLGGHGIGTEIHMDPHIGNWPCTFPKLKNQKMKVGDVFSIEPLFAIGTSKIIQKRGDAFGYYTADGSPSAHFERNIAIVEGGCILLNDLPKTPLFSVY